MLCSRLNSVVGDLEAKGIAIELHHPVKVAHVNRHVMYTSDHGLRLFLLGTAYGREDD